MIVKEGNSWVIYNHDQTKKLGKYMTKEAAEKRLKQIEMFKHIKKAVKGK
jgi:hypothetical protein